MAECPNCKHKVEAHAKAEIKPKEGKLEEFKGSKGSPSAKRFPDKPAVLAMLLLYADQRGYKRGWASNKYKDLYGIWPHSMQNLPAVSEVNMELASWIKGTQIRWAKGQGRYNHQHSNGHQPEVKGALTEREQSIINNVREQYAVGLCTQEDLEAFT
jgi:hypothetical protein